jgi:hypothetical protein
LSIRNGGFKAEELEQREPSATTDASEGTQKETEKFDFVAVRNEAHVELAGVK